MRHVKPQLMERAVDAAGRMLCDAMMTRGRVGMTLVFSDDISDPSNGRDELDIVAVVYL